MDERTLTRHLQGQSRLAACVVAVASIALVVWTLGIYWREFVTAPAASA